MHNQMLNGAVEDFFNDRLDDLGDFTKGMIKDVTGKLINSNDNSDQKNALLQQALIKAQQNKNLLMYGGIGAAALIVLILVTKKK